MNNLSKLKAFAVLIKLVSNFIFGSTALEYTPTGLLLTFTKYVNENVSSQDFINWSKQL